MTGSSTPSKLATTLMVCVPRVTRCRTAAHPSAVNVAGPAGNPAGLSAGMTMRRCGGDTANAGRMISTGRSAVHGKGDRQDSGGELAGARPLRALADREERWLLDVAAGGPDQGHDGLSGPDVAGGLRGQPHHSAVPAQTLTVTAAG